MSLRLMSLLGGGFNFFLIFTPIFQTGWLNYQLDWYFPCRQPTQRFNNRKPHDGERLRAWSLCCCRNWGLVGRLCWQPAPKAGHHFPTQKNKRRLKLAFFCFCCLFLCVVGWESNPIFLFFFLFVAVGVFFFFFVARESKNKNTKMFSLLGIFIVNFI